MAKVCSVGCVGFLVEGSSACVLVNETGSCFSGGQVHVQWCVLTLLLHLLCVFLSSHFAYLTVFGVSFSQAAGS